jgi:hypothetical protein
MAEWTLKEPFVGDFANERRIAAESFGDPAILGVGKGWFFAFEAFFTEATKSREDTGLAPAMGAKQVKEGEFPGHDGAKLRLVVESAVDVKDDRFEAAGLEIERNLRQR